MAYYRLSQVLKMRREAMEHSRFEYDVEGPSFMTVFRLESGNVRVKENTYRSLSRAMGEEESTRRGILKTKDIQVLWLMNEISNSFFEKDFEKVENLIGQLEAKLDCSVKRNQQYLDYVKAKLMYNQRVITAEDYEEVMKAGLTYGKVNFDKMIEKVWPFHERELQMLLGIVRMARLKEDYEFQRKLSEGLKAALEQEYMEAEYDAAYVSWMRWSISDVLGNMGQHREAIVMDEETCRFCEDRAEFRYLAEIYYSIFWNYHMLKKKETLTEQEEARCKECLLKAYYINKAWYPRKELYEKRVKECYPEELA